eukprot:TRINITY_DN37835_c0_g1_i1.p1 TRINITY_DN37835_c0_g1~~TRINITY_DN37835_c0_g1_i1.p1  ORF type:complete len:445 (+),score=30.60 TRINITY_DN37835_c0_g1_i1:177-1337(+)
MAPASPHVASESFGRGESVDTIEDTVMRCEGCCARFHKSCVAGHVVSAVERGRLPLTCPVPRCRHLWPRAIVVWAVDEVHVGRYDVASRSIEDLQACQGRGDVAASLSPRTTDALKRLGVRDCRRCSALIQKQAEGLLTGCDKMTCRCGSMFCFKCGMEARAGGVSRCRCVGTHHSFIAQSQVLNNYSSWGGLNDAGDQDLVKRPRGKATNEAASRLRKELKNMRKDPPPFIHVACESGDIFSWDYLIEGPPDTPYEGGWYWGRLEIPRDYPFWPPLIKMITPSGRFLANAWLCRTTQDYHPEGWRPAWTLASILLVLTTLLTEDSFTVGCIHPAVLDQEKRRLAQESRPFNLSTDDFLKAFPNFDDIVARVATRKASLQATVVAS